MRITRCYFLVLILATLMADRASVNAAAPRFMFGPPERLPEPFNVPDEADLSPSMTDDGLELVFSSWRTGEHRIYVSKRSSTSEPFSTVNELENINQRGYQGAPFISGDGLELYFQSTPSGAFTGESDIWFARRTTRNEPFVNPEPIENLNTDFFDGHASVSPDGRSLYFASHQPDDVDSELFVTTRQAKGESWEEPVQLGVDVNSSTYDYAPRMSSDGLALFFDSYRRGVDDLYVATRSSTADPWKRAVNLGRAVNTTDYEEFPFLSADGSELLFVRAQFDGNDPSRDILRSRRLPFDHVPLTGSGSAYAQNFDALGADSTTAGTSLPTGWTFTANDVVFNNATTDKFPADRPDYAGVYNAGMSGDTDRALVTDYSVDEGGELDFRVLVQNAPLQALRLGFDLEAWQVYSELGNNKGEAAFHVVLESDTGNGFAQVADLGTVTTEATLSRAATGNLVNGNDPAYRVSYDSGPRDVNVPPGATLRVRWMSTEAARQTVVFGLDNVSLRFACPGDANIDGVFNSTDLVQVFQAGEYEDTIVGNSTWSEGDWTNDNEFDIKDLIAAFQAGKYEQAGAETSSVPEPTSWVLIAVGLLSLVRNYRRNTK